MKKLSDTTKLSFSRSDLITPPGTLAIGIVLECYTDSDPIKLRDKLRYNYPGEVDVAPAKYDWLGDNAVELRTAPLPALAQLHLMTDILNTYSFRIDYQCIMRVNLSWHPISHLYQTAYQVSQFIQYLRDDEKIRYFGGTHTRRAQEAYHPQFANNVVNLIGDRLEFRLIAPTLDPVKLRAWVANAVAVFDTIYSLTHDISLNDQNILYPIGEELVEALAEWIDSLIAA